MNRENPDFKTQESTGEAKEQILEIINDPKSDIYKVEKILEESDPDGTIRRSNEVQRAVVARTKYVLQKNNFDIDDLNPLEDLLTVPEVLELDPEFKDLAWSVFDTYFNDYSPERWAVFLNFFGLSKDKDVIDSLKEFVRKSIHTNNESNDELGEFLSDIWVYFGHNEEIKEEVKKVIDSQDEYDAEDIYQKIKTKLKE